MAPESTKTPDTVRFGRDCEFNPRTGELRRSGRLLRLERIPTELLSLLVERQGQLVTRDEIIERVWGTDVFLDTGNSINAAVRKIRQVLRDDPAQPRFVQTITGRGYRFIAPVTANDVSPVPAPEEPVSPPLNPAGLPGKEVSPARALVPKRWLLGLAIVLVAVAFVAVYFRWLWDRARVQPATGQGRVVLVVLPFENLTGDAGQEYFSDGMTEEMIAQLGRLDPEHLGVIARTSVMVYKQNPKPLDQIGRELGAQYVLEGSVRRDVDKVRITAQLIQMKDQTHLWSRQYDRELSRLLVLEGEIAGEIADEIQLTLGDNRRRKDVAAKPSLSREQYSAYDLYLKGLYFWNKGRSRISSRPSSIFNRRLPRIPATRLRMPVWPILTPCWAVIARVPNPNLCPKRAPQLCALWNLTRAWPRPTRRSR